ncbi:glycine--tRNA ligase subunit beta [Pelagibacteraceae bacterium]|nr:glycine--tRNA ligase subunit beta [Pelagibacteraceae bacterium]
MSEFILELYSEEIPPNLQINARNDLQESIKSFLIEENLKFGSLNVFSSPTRLTVLLKNFSNKIKIPSKEVRGPKVGVMEDIVNNFLKAHNSFPKDLIEKQNDKGNFYYLKTKSKEILTSEILKKIVVNSIASIKWKKSMRWSDTDLLWGRPLRSILSIYNNKILAFSYGHLKASDSTIIEKNLDTKVVRVTNFNDYRKLLFNNNIILDHEEREKKIIKKFESFYKLKNFKNYYEVKLLKEVTNIVEDPHVLLIDFDKKYLELPKEIIISTLQNHQRYFPVFDKKNEITNFFLVVTNKKDTNNIIKDGNKRVVEARLADAKFFWDKDKSKNLIKQIVKLKDVKFYEGLGSIYDKTQRLRKLSGMLADEFNLNKEKAEIAASISKSDLCSDSVNEYPDLQGLMGKYFALSQGFEEDVSNAVSDHYLPLGNNSLTSKKPISYVVAISDKIDTLVGFFLINEKPTSSKDPFALRRSAIGLLRTIIDNKLNFKLRNLISYNIKLLQEQGVKKINENSENEILNFLKERMKNILRDKNIKNDIIEASISSYFSDNYFDLYKKNTLMNKYINKEAGINAISSYKRAFNIVESAKENLLGRPDAVLFRKDEEKHLFEKLNEIRKSFTVNEKDKDYEKLLLSLSEIKIFTDKFFDNVIVNDDNNDIKNNRLELLKMFCNTFNNFINFSKLEGIS